MTKSRAVFQALKKQRRERSIDGDVLAAMPFQGLEAGANLWIQEDATGLTANVCPMAGQLHRMDAQLFVNWCSESLQFWCCSPGG